MDAAPPLDPLPPPSTATSDRFAMSSACAQCHLASEGPRLRDAKGRDISPVGTWRASMMGLAARDPYYLAVFGEELAQRPAAAAAIDAACTRCHAPAGHLDLEDHGGLTFSTLVSGGEPAHVLARDGVTCSMCHQIAASGLGQPSSFTGGFSVGYGRVIWGPHGQPFTNPMQLLVNYTPSYGEHITSAAMCGTCHTVITRAIDATGQPVSPPMAEQATYLEWRSSSLARAPERPCVDCHMPTTDDDGATIESVLAVRPDTLQPRTPFGRHVFVGGNAFMLRLLGREAAWANHGVPVADLETAATRAEAHLREAAKLEIVKATREGDTLVVQVRVTNQTGHKLPTGYPGRRAWLHLTVAQGGVPRFESGALDAAGHLVAGGARLDGADTIIAHVDEVTSEAQVPVWESVPIDGDGKPTHMPLSSFGYGKDNRILPAGWAPSAADASYIRPVGVGADPDFTTGGSDSVFYRVPLAAGPAEVAVELLFQTVPPSAIEPLARAGTPAAVRFTQQAQGGQTTPVVMATATTSVP